MMSMSTFKHRWFQVMIREFALAIVAIGFAVAWQVALREAERERHNSAAVSQLVEAIGVKGAFDVTGKDIGGDPSGAARLELHGTMNGHPASITITKARTLEMDFRKASIGRQPSR